MDDAVKPKGCTNLKLRQLSRVVTRHYDAYVAATGLKNTQGWVRLGAGEDGRSRLVEATDLGRAKRAEGQRAWKQAQLALNARLGDRRVVELHALIDGCIERLGALEDGAARRD